MSSIDIYPPLHRSEHSVRIDATDFCFPSNTRRLSAIDAFYDYVRGITPNATTEALENNDMLGRVLFLGLMSGTEQYFRAIISQLYMICPIATEHAKTLQITLGAVKYYGADELGYGLLENSSFATEGEISKQTSRVLNFKVDSDQSLKQAIDAYEKLCSLRHAAVHSAGELNHRNISNLGLSNLPGRHDIKVRYDTFQKAADACMCVVRAYNRFLYQSTLQRWIDNKVLSGDWHGDKHLISALFLIFKSRINNEGPRDGYRVHQKLKSAIIKRLST